MAGEGQDSSSWEGSSAKKHSGRVLGGRWQVGGRIGTGGMAVVYRGTDLRLERPVAVKILHDHISESADARERLAREARAIAQLRHENVIEVYDYSIEEEHCTWLITELITGGSLRDFLTKHPTPSPEVAVMIVAEITRALHAAHQVGVIHRDVKPDNILVDPAAGRPKLSDFGIAKVLGESQMTLTGNLVGSPSYMSPEQADGRKTDHRTDLFSVGILLYRLVTGKLPFHGQTAIDTIRKVALVKFTDPLELEPNCPAAIAAIIRKAMSPRLEDRYQQAEDLLADLGRILEDAQLVATHTHLPRYFANPSEYLEQIRPQLAKNLEVRGRMLMASGEESRAVDCLNRAISLGSNTQNTVDLVRELSSRRRRAGFARAIWSLGIGAAALCTLGVGLFALDVFSTEAPTVTGMTVEEAIATPQPAPIRQAPDEVVDPEPPAEVPAPAEIKSASGDAAPSRVKTKTSRRKRRSRRARSGARAAKAKADPKPTKAAPLDPAPSEVAPQPKPGTLQVGTGVWVDILIDGKRMGRAPDRSQFALPPGDYQLRAEKPNCLPFERKFTIRPGQKTRIRISVECS